MSEVILQHEVRAEATPELAARLFCAMDDGQQAEFFEWCARINEEWREEWERGGKRGCFISGGQWWHIGRKLAERPMFDPAREVLEQIAAPLFVHALNYMEDNSKLQLRLLRAGVTT